MPAVFPTNGANGFVKSVWEEELLEAYQSQSILSVVAHQIQPVGVEGKYYINKFNSGGALVEDYNAGQPLDYSTVGTTRIEVKPDQAKVWAVRLPDINEASIIKSLRTPVIQQAGHELSVAVDRHAMESILASNVEKKVITTAAYANFDPYAEIIEANMKMSIANVPVTGRVAIVSHQVLAMLMKDPRFIASYAPTEGILQNGLIPGCKINGVEIVVAGPERFPVTTGFMLIHKDQAYGHMELLNKTEVMRDKDYFDDLLRGLMVFGGSVIREESIIVVGRDDEVTA